MARGTVAAPASETTAPPPRANPDLDGHEAAERELRRLFEGGRLPHALLLSGPRGIGKATLAFRLARFVLARSGFEREHERASQAREEGLAIAPDSGVFRRVAAGGHADLLTVERGYDPRRRRMRSEIIVADARDITAFMHLTPAEGGWRIVVVDGADELNRNAANALLKILEEPPRRSLLILVAHMPGQLLPTIRSRCCRVPLSPLAPAVLRRLLARYRPDLAETEAEGLLTLADGSIGRALDLAQAGGLELYRSVLALVARLDPGVLHAFADRLARPEAEDGYRIVQELVARFLARIAIVAARHEAEAPPAIADGEREAMRRLSGPDRAPIWAGLRDEIARDFARTDELNLDRKQAILGAFFAIDRAAG
ncbi:MAG: DNA polymerase III subunit delta' [Alphaproteobacteria bacterium]|nr:DNA polymerase III subunit delta' [Alphaproteobacteria bacterium]